jgi:ABC-2 type transport system permease protein
MIDSLRNILVMIELEVRRLLHDRTELYFRILQPVLWIGVFGPIMGSVRAIPTGGLPYIDYIAPGVLIQSTTFVSIHYGLSIVWERESGILKKLLVTPIPRYAIVIGRSLSSGVRAVFQVLIIIPIALLIGVRFVLNPLFFAFALLVIFFASGGFAALSVLVASLVKTRERFMGVGQVLTMPLFFASNALYPVRIMPLALQYFALLNPMSYEVDAVRSLMVSGDLSNLLIDVMALLIFDVIMFVAASAIFKKIIQ